ncbi:MAG: hypothetical protein II802_04160, partial [Clostridia bacterium]|nr:hypothetical protein [Clostridia bacterium]
KQYDEDEKPPVPDFYLENHHIKDEKIITILYDKQNDEISFFSDDNSLDSDAIIDAVYEIAELKEDFGTLRDYNIIYYKEGNGNNYKIALTDTSYIGSRTLKNSLLLLLVFIISLGLFFLISIRLSKLAAKPMEKAIEMERQFVADISHDLKTPITVILANNSILKSTPNATVSEQAQWIESTDTAAKNMMTMVNEMLTLSSLESVVKTVIKEPVNLSAVAEKSVLQMESIAYDRQIIVESDIAEDVIVFANTDYIGRICNGLIENALKYEPDGGKVKISLKKIKKKAIFSVQNLGSLIEKEDLPHIFERFYRGDKARSIQKGHGLGLPIIKQITELLGAEIKVSSEKESGTVFTVTFDSAE